MRRIFLSVSLLALGATPVLAQSSDKPLPPKDRKDPNYVRCRLIDVTGSLVKKEKTCKTNKEWEALRTRGNSDAERFIEQSRTGANPNG
jgi:hypothetical protein